MIEIINPQLDATYMDVWGEYLPFAIRSWLPILEAGCFVPRWYQAPLNGLQFMTAGDYSSWSLQIPAGSFILAILHTPQSDVPNGGDNHLYISGAFNVQVTDTGLQHIWFSDPLPDNFFYKGLNDGRNGHVLPKPYPVISPGNFQIERWCTVTGSCELLFAVAVPKAVA